MSIRYRFAPEDDGRVDVINPTGVLVCWLPESLAGELQRAYRRRLDVDWVVANEWMEGVLFGVHASLAFGNAAPDVKMDIRAGISGYVMGDPPWVAERA